MTEYSKSKKEILESILNHGGWSFNQRQLLSELIEEYTEKETWTKLTCIDDGTLNAYVGLTDGQIYEIKNHPNSYFVTVKKTDDGVSNETYPKRLFV